MGVTPYSICTQDAVGSVYRDVDNTRQLDLLRDGFTAGSAASIQTAITSWRSRRLRRSRPA
jgi:hypothetical protein